MTARQTWETDLHEALAEMHAAKAMGRTVDIGPPSTDEEMAALLLAVPDLPLHVRCWCELCSFARWAWARVLGARCPEQGSSIVTCLRLADVGGTVRRLPVAKDLFGCIYCVDVHPKRDDTPVFLTEYASPEDVIYHVASSVPKFLRLLARAVTLDDPDWEDKRDLVLSIDPAIEDVEDVRLPWIVLAGDDDRPDWIPADTPPG